MSNQGKSNAKSGFTLIELLVVIAIIAILAAILFPVFAQAREKARQATCVSNVKQFLLAIIQYNQDYDEGEPITFKDVNSFGSGTLTNGQPITSLNKEPDYKGQETGIPFEIAPYLKAPALFLCPDDHQITLAEATKIKAKSLPGGGALSLYPHNTYYQLYGTSYKFTNQNYSHPDPVADPNAVADTGYSGGRSTATSDNPCASSSQTGCDWIGNNAQIVNENQSFGQAQGGTLPGAGSYGYSEVTTSAFTRPSETRCVGDWVKTFADSPANAGGVPMHPLGVSIGYMDGHAKFIISEGSTYYKGCDGLDWAWDLAGSCNLKGLQRDAD